MDRIFANTVRYYRKRAKLSQEEVARRTGIAQSEVSRLEEGARWPTQKTIRRLCKTFGISTWEFCQHMAEDMLALPKEKWLEYDDDEEDEDNG